ncbi:MAG: 23S rRNA (uracil(1939)-C(5))-methyltransferase RlmD [Holophagae bacterium]|jgi:23S rRNA (uracil1939-C5)-methyltransferase
MALPPNLVDCQHRTTCGACSLLRQPYGRQLIQKQRWLQEALDGPLRLRREQVLETVPSPKIEGYRSRAKMAISTDRQRYSALGYFQRRSREVVDAPDCRVLVPELLETTEQLRTLLNSPVKVPFLLRHIDLRCGTDPTRQHLTLVVKSEDLPALPVDELVDNCPHLTGIAVNRNPSGGRQVIKGPIDALWGAREVWVETEGLSLRVSPGSFFQVNLELLPEIHGRMRDFLGTGRLLVDLYAGVGTHGLALRDGFGKVLCIEGVRRAVADARATIAKSRIDGVEVVASPVLRALRRLHNERPDAVVLNPSAVGAEPQVLQAICRSPARRVAYLSCSPATLARDLGVLVKGGFSLHTVQALDMMPQTSQVEALALLNRNRR